MAPPDPSSSFRRAGAAAVVTFGAAGAAWSAMRGVDLSFSMCAMGGCSEPESSGTGGLFLLGAGGIVLAGLLAAPHLAGASRPWLRSAAALPAATATGLVLLLLGVPSLGPWAENVTLFAVVGAALAVMVPPGRPVAGASSGSSSAPSWWRSSATFPGPAWATPSPSSSPATGLA